MRFGITVLLSLITTFLFSQSDCTVQIANEQSVDITLREGFTIIQEASTGEEWSIEPGLITLELAPGANSAELLISEFNPNIPEGSELIGVGISVRGRAIGGNINDQTIRYESADGNSDNYANNVNLGNAWSSGFSRWSYGNNRDLMGGPATFENLNADNIDIRLQIENTGDEASTVEIYQVGIVLRFRTPFTICPDHLCVIFYLPDATDAAQYTWDTPDGFELLENTSTNIVGIVVDPAVPTGLYDICVNENLNGAQDECCRTVRLSDCTPGSIGDAVFIDDNLNGIFDNGEEGLSSVEVVLYNDELDILETTFTDSNGNYQFGDITEGYYQVGVNYNGLLSPSFASSFSENQGSELLSDIFYVVDSEIVDDLDFGFRQLFSIDGTVWNDENCDGFLSITEDIFEGLTVELIDTQGSIVASTLSDDDGNYTFTQLIDGDYSIMLSGHDESLFIPSLNPAGTDVNALQLIDGVPTTGTFTLDADAEFNLGLKFQGGTVAGQVFLDFDLDNIIDSDEDRISDVEISLFSCSGDLVTTTVTGQDGNYRFDNVVTGDYYIQFTAIEGLFTQSTTTSIDPLNNDISNENGMLTTSCFDVAINQVSNISGGFFAPGVIGDFVWNDTNANGLQDEGEEGINGVLVQLTDSDGALVGIAMTGFSMTTERDGHYMFNNVIPGDYYLSFSLPANTAYTQVVASSPDQNSDVTGGNGVGTTDLITVASGETNFDIDAGLVVATSSISGQAWTDFNADGIRGTEDLGIEGLAVSLVQNGLVQSSTTTDTEGNYTFSPIFAGMYQVQFESTLEVSPFQAGSDNTIDSDITVDGSTGLIDVSIDETVSNVDAGFYQLASISGSIYLDENTDDLNSGDALYDEEVVVTLLNVADGSTSSVTALGTYSFEDLIPGNYFISIPLPQDFTASLVSGVQNEENNFDIGDVGGVGILSSETITITSSTMLTSIDAGLQPPIFNNSVSGYVFDDVSGNGFSEDEDFGIANATVTATLDNGDTFTTVTDDGGLYTLDELPNGVYTLSISIDPIYQLTDPNVESDEADDTNDSDFIQVGDAFILEGFELSGDVSIINVDAGFFRFGTISGVIWNDTNGDGIRTDDEMLFEGFNVSLGGDFPSEDMLTSNSGYAYTTLRPGTYLISYDLGEDIYIFSPALQGTDSGVDSNIELFNATGGTTRNIFIESGTVVSNVDIGLTDPAILLGSISGVVWLDIDNDGIRGADDLLLADYPVTLNTVDGPINAVTSADGSYTFEDLAPGVYNIASVLQGDFQYTIPNAGSDDSVDSDIALIANGTTSNLFLQVSGELTNVDIGLIDVPEEDLGVVSGLIFHDNFDGLSIDDLGLEGVEVSLIDLATSTAVATTSSDVFGNYAFDMIPNGFYQLSIDLPVDFILTIPNIGTNDDVDSDFILSGVSDIVTSTFEINEDNFTHVFDAGFYQTGVIQGLVWVDINGDGIRNLDDDILSPYTIDLFKDGVLYDTVESDDSGYIFENLVPAAYFVSAEIDGQLYTATLGLQGSDTTLDSDFFNINDTGATSGNLFINSGTMLSNIDLGLIPAEDTGDGLNITVDIFEDANADGLSVGDLPFNTNLVVSLFDIANNNFVATISEANVSQISLSNLNLDAGEYLLTIGAVETLTDTDVGMDDSIDSDFELDDSGDFFIVLNVDESTEDIELDLGVYIMAEIGGRIWQDINQNGIQDSADELSASAGVANVIMFVTDLSLNVIAVGSSDADGNYLFSGLKPGDYLIGSSIPGDSEYTTADQGGDDNLDSDIAMSVGVNGFTMGYTLSSGDSNTTVDIGVISDFELSLESVLSGFVWEDIDGDGIFDDNEVGDAGVIVRLFEEDGTIIFQTMTDETGFYQLETLVVGNIFLGFIDLDSDLISTLPFEGTDELLDSDVTNANGPFTTELIFLSPSSVNEGVNLGYFRTGSVGDFVWDDLNSDGIQGASEPGFDGVQLNLFNSAGTMLATTTTDSQDGVSGLYSFDDLNPGIYTISVVAPEGFGATEMDAGGDDDLDSDLDNFTMFSSEFNVLSNQANNSVDFGLATLPAGLGNKVFIDLNGDNVQSEGEPGLDNVKVDLYAANGTYIETSITETINGESGIYGFNQVSTGEYYLVFTPTEDEYLFVMPNMGSSDITDSDVTSTIEPGSTSIFSITNGIPDVDIDAGVYLPSTVGDYVWNDDNENGIQDATEAGFNGMLVEIYRSTGEFVATTMTDLNGFYEFNEMQAGSYYVRFRVEGLFKFTTQDAGGDDENDSDAGTTGLTEIFDLEYNTVQTQWDAGVTFAQARISGVVWDDADSSGSREFNEDGMENVRVEVLDENGSTLMEARTDQLGYYAFDINIKEKVFIAVNAPNGYLFSDSPSFIPDDENSDVGQSGLTELMDLNSEAVRTHIDAGLFLFNGVKVKVFPNPTVESVQIEVVDPFLDVEEFFVRVFDQGGHMVLSETIALEGPMSDKIDLGNIASGIYQVYMEANGRMWKQQIIVID